jgi:hypothetical protein
LVGVAVKLTRLPAQTVFDGAAMLTAGTRIGFTVIVIAFELTGVATAQFAFEVNKTVTRSPFTNTEVEKLGELVPAFRPLTFHWYTGAVPPFTGDAVKVTLAPGQMLVLDALMVTAGVTTGFTVTVIELEVADDGDAHARAEVMITFMISPLASVLLVKLAAFVPAFTPFTCH